MDCLLIIAYCLLPTAYFNPSSAAFNPCFTYSRALLKIRVEPKMNYFEWRESILKAPYEIIK